MSKSGQVAKGAAYHTLMRIPASVFTAPIFARLIRMPFVGAAPSRNQQPFYVAVTIDTEPGYVAPSGRRVWGSEAPRAFVGYERGIANWRMLAQRLDIRLTFLLSTQCFAATGREYRAICEQLLAAVAEGHKLGLHLHPREDEALQRELGRRLVHTSSRYYGLADIEAMLNASRHLISRHLGADVADRVTSFRWGNWALSTQAVSALQNTGFTVDSSACPGMAGHLDNDRAYDWRRVVTQHPWWLDPADYQITDSHRSDVLELPVSVLELLNGRYRADPSLGGILLPVLQRFHLRVRQGTAPFVFVILSHSSEATLADGRPTRLLSKLEEVVRIIRRQGEITFVTLSEARKQVLASKRLTSENQESVQ